MTAQLCINKVLPEVEIDLIFSFLPKRALLNCSEACRQWRRIASGKNYWMDLAVRMGVKDPASHDNLRVVVGTIMTRIRMVIKEVEFNSFWKQSETPSWMFLVYDRRLLRVHNQDLQDTRDRKWKVKEAHRDKVLQAFTGYLGLYLSGGRTDEQAFETACILKEKYQSNEGLMQLGEVYLFTGNMDGALRVAISLPKESDQAALLLKIVEYLHTHKQNRRAHAVVKMIPYTQAVERRQAQELMAGGG